MEVRSTGSSPSSLAPAFVRSTSDQEVIAVQELLTFIRTLINHPAIQNDNDLLPLFRNKAEILSHLAGSTELNADDQAFYRMAKQLIPNGTQVSSLVKKLLLKNASITKSHPSPITTLTPSISSQLSAAPQPRTPFNPAQPQEEIPSNSSPLAVRVSTIQSIRINTSGEDGTKGKNGDNGRGVDGTHGTDGEGARDINLRLSVDNQTVAVQWETGNSFIQLGNGAASIFLHAVGGKGGNGGTGGKGMSGTRGISGSPATRYSIGGMGWAGGPGGPGGNGGNAGNGGRGGHVKVYAPPQDSDLLMLINVPETTGGAQGLEGAGGQGGEGGPGGAGGAPCYWYETLRNAQGKNTSVSRFTQGGMPGPNGEKGADGSPGKSGTSGYNGSFDMIVGNTVYKKRYDLQVTVSKIVDLTRGNPRDFYEPGEQVNFEVTVTNTGGMPTPPQDIDVSPLPANWIEADIRSFSLGSSSNLKVGGSHTFTPTFTFRVKEQPPLIGDPLNKQEPLTYNAKLRRVNKSFPSVSAQKDYFPVRYPVGLSPLKGKVAIIFGETSIVDLLIQNIASITMGRNGEQKRRLFVTFEVSDNSDIKSKDVELLKTEHEDLQEPNKITMEIDALSPKSEKKLAVSFRFVNPSLRTQAKIRIVASLYLDSFKSAGDLTQTRCIQKRMLYMQFCERYHYNPLADVLLIYHAGVSMDELAKWRDQLRVMELTTSVWSTSYYENINFAQNIEGVEGTLEKHFARKTVIILNQPFHGREQAETVDARLPKREIFRIGRDFNIKTYVIGNALPIDQCYPSTEDIAAARSEEISGRFTNTSKLSEEFDNEVEQFAEKLRKENPLQRNVIVKSFAWQKVDGICKYQLGTIKVCSAGFMNRATILSNKSTISGLQFINSTENIYALFKMVPFERKLELLKSTTISDRQHLEEAIISDLADEQYAFSQEEWTGDWDTKKIKTGLELLNLLVAMHLAQDLPPNNPIKTSVKKIMLYLRAFISLTPETKDKLPNRRQRILAQATKQLIDTFLKPVFGEKKDWHGEYKKDYIDPLGRLDRSQLWQITRNPYLQGFYQDNWGNHSNIVNNQEINS